MDYLKNVYTMKEAATLWSLSETAIRKAISSGRLIESVDYRKSGRITLVNKSAMERLYGKLDN